MKEKLEALSKIELIEVANSLNIYHPEKFKKDELIERIMIASGEKLASRKSKPAVITKRTRRTWMWHVMFISFLMISIISSLFIILNRFYFFPVVFQSVISSTQIYGMVLTLSSTAFSFYIYYRWWKIGSFSGIMLISTVMSIGWFTYSAIIYYHNISDLEKYKLLKQSGVWDKISGGLFTYYRLVQYQYFYWAMIALMAAAVVTPLTMYVLLVKK